MTVLTPYAREELDTVPESLVLEVWDGNGAPDVDLAGVDFYVPPYFSREGVGLLEKLPSLRVVQTQTAGVDDIRDLIPAGVTLCNARGVHDASTSELAVGLMLAAQRHLDDFVRAQTEARWDQRRVPSLADRTVLILGYGSIGEAVERRLAGFEVDIVRVASKAREGVHGVDELPELLPRADIVVVLVPLTDATRGLVDAAFLGRLRDGATLVNVARGAIVDTDALLAELQSGRLRAALDVTDPEPLPAEHPLWHAPGVIITPHVGGATSAMQPRMRRLLSAQLRRYAAGEQLANIVD